MLKRDREGIVGFPFPAIRRTPGDVYTHTFLGTQRAARYPDEAGAVAVVDQTFGGRIAIVPVHTAPLWAEVRSLP